jgi:hypothetical protein
LVERAAGKRRRRDHWRVNRPSAFAGDDNFDQLDGVFEQSEYRFAQEPRDMIGSEPSGFRTISRPG